MFAGQAVQVACFASQGDLPLNLTWSFNGKQDLSSLGILTSKIGQKGSNLFIESITEEHRGYYDCTVENSAGIDRYSAFLEIHGNNNKKTITSFCLRCCDLWRNFKTLTPYFIRHFPLSYTCAPHI